MRLTFSCLDMWDFLDEVGPRTFCLPSEKIEFHCALQNARRRGVNDIAKGRAANVPIDRRRAVELRMVEDVEGLDAEQHRLRSGQRQALGQRHKVVVRAGAIEKPALCRARSTQRIHGERRGVDAVINGVANSGGAGLE